jgi:hypothetical protein
MEQPVMGVFRSLDITQTPELLHQRVFDLGLEPHIRIHAELHPKNI